MPRVFVIRPAPVSTAVDVGTSPSSAEKRWIHCSNTEADVGFVFFLPALFDTVNSKKGSQKGQRGIIKTRFRRHTAEQKDSEAHLPPGSYTDFLGRKRHWFQCSFLSRKRSQNLARCFLGERRRGVGISKLWQTTLVSPFRKTNLVSQDVLQKSKTEFSRLKPTR